VDIFKYAKVSGKFTPCKIPRRSDILVEDMTVEEATGTVNAEWVENSCGGESEKAVNSDDEKVILYFHGGAFVMCSSRELQILLILL
jgi:acetyl esterase/lipase